MKKRIVTLVAAALLLLAFALPACADFDPASRNSVAVVYTCLDTDAGEIGFAWGTGFFVSAAGENPANLITNCHVIEDFLDSGQGDLFRVNIDGTVVTGRAKIRVYYDARDYEEAYVVGYDALKDVAVLKLGAPTSKRISLPLEVPTDNMVGSTVYAVGFPGLSDNEIAGATSSWGTSDSTVTRGTISRLFLTAGTGVSTVQIDCDIKHGNSGGPLISDSGTVIGINTYGVNDSEESINYAINISEAITLLNQYSVPYATGAAKPQGSGASAGGGEGETALQPVPAPTPQPAPSGFPVWAIILIAVIVVAAAVVVFVVMKGKKNQPQPQPIPQPQPAPMPVQRAPSRGGYVRSLSTQHRGSRVSVGTQPVLLGRGQDCAVMYSSDTPGVSGRHCSLSWDSASGEFTLTDLQSTYGTFLQNGQKLTPNMAYRLRSGDRFYLGDPANSLQVNVE